MKNEVQQLREEQNLTQAELAAKSGVSLRTIQRIEAGYRPKGFTLRAIAKALEVKPDVLVQNNSLDSEIDRAKIINISSLSFLLLPFGNIIIPAILTSRTKNKRAKALGKSVLSIQIVWTCITCILMIVSPFLQVQLSLKIPLFMVFLVVLICINAIIILKNGYSLNQHQELAIKLKNSIL
ncbi:hypothetical protein GCM10027429_13170 [Marivirga atlantica]|uniref:Helix-turn-helix domain-containing protein n=1 Tax=Marivirga atlantica TaxID=1548457 RepID=A0A937DIE4_9BACT|nr:helix-turn-helix domain-containing protein [Marivirga atlantica]MBL0764930.1 helix-turn-helix domain-containing protein [Marivirga atlantica]